MDWTTLLKAQQTDFIQRIKTHWFKFDSLLHCQIKGKHSELTVISGEQLTKLRNFCWDMADKFKQRGSVRQIFITNMQGKLAEEVIEARLAERVTKVNYQVTRRGDGRIDFTLTHDPAIGIQVKSRQCWHSKDLHKIRWRISAEEIEKNSVLVCILIKGKLEDDQAKQYNLVLAGFLPTNLIKPIDGKAEVGIDELLYGGGLCGYLDNLLIPKLESYIKQGDQSYQKQDYSEAIANYSNALKINSNQPKIYYTRGLCHLATAKKDKAVKDFTETLNLDSKFAPAYYNRGLVLSDLGDKEAAIKDFNKAVNINPNYVAAYFNRGKIFVNTGNNKAAIIDFQKAADFYQKQGRQADYEEILGIIRQLEP